MKNSGAIKVAIADDAPSIREIVRHIFSLDEKFLLVSEAKDGLEAIDAALLNDLDVMIMDLVMPNKNGIEACKEILQIKPKLKIIACSTIDQESMVMKALDAGCCSYLAKPFSAEQLKETITHSFKGGRK